MTSIGKIYRHYKKNAGLTKEAQDKWKEMFEQFDIKVG